MGNSLGIELEGKDVVISQEYLIPLSEIERVFRVSGGFGASAHTGGTALFGTFLADGDRCRMHGSEVERLATSEEVEAAEKLFQIRQGV